MKNLSVIPFKNDKFHLNMVVRKDYLSIDILFEYFILLFKKKQFLKLCLLTQNVFENQVSFLFYSYCIFSIRTEIKNFNSVLSINRNIRSIIVFHIN